MDLKNVRLTLANVARTTNSKTMPVNRVSTIHKKDDAGNWTEEVIGYVLECSAYRGDVLKVKFPLTVKDHYEELEKLLGNDMLVEVSFTGLKLTPYAMKLANGTLLSGVSAKATDFSIASSTQNLLEDFEIEE